MPSKQVCMFPERQWKKFRGSATYQSLSPLMLSFCARGAFAWEANQRRLTLCKLGTTSGLENLAYTDGLCSGTSFNDSDMLDEKDSKMCLSKRLQDRLAP